jgi:hypothetical protein
VKTWLFCSVKSSLSFLFGINFGKRNSMKKFKKNIALCFLFIFASSAAVGFLYLFNEKAAFIMIGIVVIHSLFWFASIKCPYCDWNLGSGRGMLYVFLMLFRSHAKCDNCGSDLF